jgi:hypothetical protein
MALLILNSFSDGVAKPNLGIVMDYDMKYLEPLSNLFDRLHQFWENPKSQKFVGVLLIAVFLVGLTCIELKRQGFLPSFLAAYFPENHFYAINLAFSMLLVLEVMSLIFVLSSSVTRSIGKQFEILSLILLRHSFQELSHMHEPIDIIADWVPALHILTSSTAALLIFVFLGIYYRIRRYQRYLSDPVEKMHYIMTKKILALGLLAIFIAVGAYNTSEFLFKGIKHDFFETFYTILIFADILLVLIAQRFMPSFHAVFRNSGYVIATLFIRMALAAPPYYDAVIGLVAAAFALGVTYATNIFHYGALVPKEKNHFGVTDAPSPQAARSQ